MNVIDFIKLVFGILAIITIIQFTFWAISYSKNPTKENLEKGTDLIADSAVPIWIWWIKGLARFGAIGAILIIGLIFILIKVGVIQPR